MTDTFSPLTLNDKIANSNLWCYPGEELHEGEMRVTLMGTGWGDIIRHNQKGPSIFIELGLSKDGSTLNPNNISEKVETFVFDVGPGCGINYNTMQVPFSRMEKIFLTHLHMDHCSDLSWIYGFGPSKDRFNPLQIFGPHNFNVDKIADGSRLIPNMFEFVKGLKYFTNWHEISFETTFNVQHGYNIHIYPLDYHGTPPENLILGEAMAQRRLEYQETARTLMANQELPAGVTAYPAPEPGIAYHDEENGVIIKHWPALHIIDGAISYRLEWNGMSVVWSGDTQPNYYMAHHGAGANLLIHETAPSVSRYSTASQISKENASNIVAQSHTPARALGKILSMANPDMAVTCHCPIDPEEWQSYIKGVAAYWNGTYQIGEDLMVFKLSRPEEDAIKPHITVRKGGIHERPWNYSLLSNPGDPKRKTLNIKDYRTEMFNSPNDDPPGMQIPKSEYEPSQNDSNN